MLLDYNIKIIFGGYKIKKEIDAEASIINSYIHGI